MDTYREPARDLEIIDRVDICVIGGSCTGVAAAITAARLGARVALIENNGFFGGVATASLVNIWHSLFDTECRRRIIAGFTETVVDRLQRRHAVEIYDPPTPHRYAVLNTDELKIELDEMIGEQSRIRPFLHTRFCAPLVQDGDLVGIAIEDKTGRRAILASQFIDASGDADLTHRLQLSTRKHDDLQPPTTCALVYGLDEVREANPEIDINSAPFNPDYPEALPRGFFWHAAVTGVPNLRMLAGTRINGADCSDADQLTQAEMKGRSMVRRICDVYRRHLAGGDQVMLAGLPAYIGIRETRMVDCLYHLTEDDVLSGRRFDDTIAQGSYRVDIHHSDKDGLTFRYLDGTEVYSVPGEKAQTGRWRPEQPADPTWYNIPYRSLVPRGATNLLVAGRAIDTDRGAHGATRVMVNCNQTGEAAGAAAYLALDSSCTVDRVDTTQLRASLNQLGSALH